MKIKNLFKKNSVEPEVPEVVETPTEMIEIKVAGFDFYQNELKELLTMPNEDYSLSAKAFREEVFDRCYQFDTEWLSAEIVPEPENEFDPNALAVYVDGVRIGYVPRKDQAKVNSVTPTSVDVEIYGGKFKDLDEDDNIIKGETPYKANLYLTVEK